MTQLFLLSIRRQCYKKSRSQLYNVINLYHVITILAGIKDGMLQLRHIEESGFTRDGSAVNHIYAEYNLIQSRKKYPLQLCIAYVDLMSAFDSVDRTALWELLHFLLFSREDRGSRKSPTVLQ